MDESLKIAVEKAPTPDEFKAKFCGKKSPEETALKSRGYLHEIGEFLNRLKPEDRVKIINKNVKSMENLTL